ncbi:telomerase inhibitor [Maublancomyces gigas]|uniref:Telomerase inhibitor n=1 Tax=Discina gigas TaxID=1032678 RepID=A0ABR3GBW4_9PEZI
MGLAAPRNRTKIGHDPRNTTWANSTSRFGHRILTTLGWTPGSTLGDSSSLYHQSGHITEASQAGVKIVLKDDNLGIGCNKRAREDQCVGLDGLQDLLGRLNGKDEEQLGKEADSREKLRREVIVGQRYGMRFVRGETYVSSDIEALLKKIKGEKKDAEEGETKIKKEGGESDGELVKTEDTESSTVRVKREKKEKKSRREKSSSKSTSATPAPSIEADSKESFKKRKRTDDDDSSKVVKEERASKEGKAPKMSKKSKNGETREERRARREREKREKKARKAGRRNEKRKSSDSDSSDDENSTAPSGTATPSYPALVGRQAVRHRYIAAKRSSVMDAKALNEIFMIKA